MHVKRKLGKVTSSDLYHKGTDNLPTLLLYTTRNLIYAKVLNIDITFQIGSCHFIFFLIIKVKYERCFIFSVLGCFSIASLNLYLTYNRNSFLENVLLHQNIFTIFFSIYTLSFYISYSNSNLFFPRFASNVLYFH